MSAAAPTSSSRKRKQSTSGSANNDHARKKQKRLLDPGNTTRASGKSHPPNGIAISNGIISSAELGTDGRISVAESSTQALSGQQNGKNSRSSKGEGRGDQGQGNTGLNNQLGVAKGTKKKGKGGRGASKASARGHEIPAQPDHEADEGDTSRNERTAEQDDDNGNQQVGIVDTAMDEDEPGGYTYL